MTEGRFLRNHWSMVASNTVRSLAALAFVQAVVLVMGGNFSADLYLLIFAVMAAVVLTVNIIIWQKTKYYFEENELVVERTTLVRSETRIQYDRLASVNVERDAVCRILGATKLSFNLNSSVNASSAEAFIVLKAAEAEAVRRDIDMRIFGKAEPEAVQEKKEEESLVHVTVWDIFLHAVFGMSSGQLGLGMVMLAYSVISYVYGGTITILTAFLFAMDFLIPAVSVFFRLYRYRITRTGDAVSVSSGFFSTREHSFLLSKVNYVKVREPFLCRLMGRAILEVEVVGTADSKGVPILCPLKPKKVAMDLLHSLLPEFECSGERIKQERVSIVGLCFWAAAVVSISCAAAYGISREIPAEFSYIPWICVAAAAVLCAVWVAEAFGIRRFACDGTIVMMVTGSFDRTVNYILMDKIQFADVRSSPIQRRAGAATCRLGMLSTAGASSVTSGVFPAEELEAISSTVMDRILDGRYDFRRFQ